MKIQQGKKSINKEIHPWGEDAKGSCKIRDSRQQESEEVEGLKTSYSKKQNTRFNNKKKQAMLNKIFNFSNKKKKFVQPNQLAYFQRKLLT